MSIDALQVLKPGEQLLYEFDWSGAIAEPTTMIGVSYSAPAPLQTWGAQDIFDELRSIVGVRGALHGQTYVVKATASLSSGEQVQQDLVIVGMA